MAARFLVAGGDGNWNNTNNWATASGGASGASFPTSADAVTFDSASGNAPMTVNVSSAALSLTVTGTYAGTLTFNAQLAVSGSITFISGMTLAGTTGPLVPNATGTLTSGGKTIPCPLTFGVSATYTLADNWAVTGLVTAGVTTGTTTINQSTTQSLTCNGGFHQAGTSAAVGGTAKLVLGGGTWDSASTGTNTMNIDLAGNVTVSGSLLVGASSKTLTYVSGTITTAGSTLTVQAPYTLNTAGVTWSGLVLTTTGATYTVSSALAWSGTLTLGNTTTTIVSGAGALSGTGGVALNGTGVTLNNTGGLTTTGTMTMPNSAFTFAGSAGFTTGTLTNTSYTASRTVTLGQANTYTVTAAFSNVGTTSAITQALVSSVGGSRVTFTVQAGATTDLLYCNPTDVDSSAGITVVSFRGTLTNTLNWATSGGSSGGTSSALRSGGAAISIPKSTAYTVMVKALLSTDHVSAATGKTLAVTISKAGAAFGNPAAGASNATEVSNGWYKFALGTSDTDTQGDLTVRMTSSGVDDVERVLQVVNANNAGLAALPDTAVSSNASLLTSGTGTAQVSVSGGVAQADLQTIKTQTVTCAGGVTVPAATLASTTNITAASGVALSAAGLDSISVSDPGAPGSMTTLPKMMVGLWRWFFKKTTLTSTTLTVYANDGSTPNGTATVSDDGTTQTKGALS